MTATEAKLRWIVSGDIREMLQIEHVQFDHPWSRSDFDAVRRDSQVGVRVAEIDTGCGYEIVGYIVWMRLKDRLEIVNLAVAPEHERQGYGKALVRAAWGALVYGRRHILAAHVRETNKDAQLFLKACGFVCTHIVGGYYAETPEDAYHFEIRRADQ